MWRRYWLSIGEFVLGFWFPERRIWTIAQFIDEKQVVGMLSRYNFQEEFLIGETTVWGNILLIKDVSERLVYLFLMVKLSVTIWWFVLFLLLLLLKKREADKFYLVRQFVSLGGHNAVSPGYGYATISFNKSWMFIFSARGKTANTVNGGSTRLLFISSSGCEMPNRIVSEWNKAIPLPLKTTILFLSRITFKYSNLI